MFFDTLHFTQLLALPVQLPNQYLAKNGQGYFGALAWWNSEFWNVSPSKVFDVLSWEGPEE